MYATKARPPPHSQPSIFWASGGPAFVSMLLIATRQKSYPFGDDITETKQPWAHGFPEHPLHYGGSCRPLPVVGVLSGATTKFPTLCQEPHKVQGGTTGAICCCQPRGWSGTRLPRGQISRLHPLRCGPPHLLACAHVHPADDRNHSRVRQCPLIFLSAVGWAFPERASLLRVKPTDQYPH